MEQTAESKAFFFSNLNLDQIDKKNEINRLGEFIAHIKPPKLQKARPLYNEYKLAEALHLEIEQYRNEWSENGLSRLNYKILEALTNWIGNAYSDGYPKRGLYPAQSLSQRLVGTISTQLEKPEQWTRKSPCPRKRPGSQCN